MPTIFPMIPVPKSVPKPSPVGMWTERIMPLQSKVDLIHTRFFKADGDEITFYVTRPGDSQDWVLTDACSFLSDADASGLILKPQVLQGLVRTYGLKLSSEMTLFDDSVGIDMDQRKWRFAACLVALDGVLRMWGASSPIRMPSGTE